ncbi:CHAT domain-containing tetratricopeptide repeat protein [Streptomyces afghaniensis]|uniref:CHAT domain-containing tetratricopeptide repeat protein n=1 Tax=Streptomyces afghaniensis TaxID=66865 RepID=UPI0037A7D2DF
MRDTLISRITTPVSRVFADHDLGHCLDPEALRAARELMAWHSRERPGGVDVGVFTVVASLHWMRYQALPPALAEEDLRTALRLCRVLYDIDPSLLAPPMRAFVEEGDARLVSLKVTVLSEAAIARAERPGDTASRVSALDEAAALLRQALVIAQPVPSEVLVARHRLGTVHRLRFQCTGLTDDIDRSELWHRTAVGAVADDSEVRPVLLHGLGTALATRFGRDDELRHADEAIEVLREAVRTVPVADAGRPSYLGDLTNILLSRFEKTEQGSDLIEAWETIHEALRAAPPGTKYRALVLSNLCRAARLRFDCSNEGSFLDEAVAAGREALALTPSGTPEFAETHNKLGLALGRRYVLLGRTKDLDGWVESARTSVSAVAPGHPDRPRYLTSLAQSLMESCQRPGRTEDLEEAVACCRQADRELGPGDPHRTAVLATLCGALARRFRVHGRPADIDAALEAGYQAADAAVPGSSQQAAALGNLLAALTERHAYTRQASDLEEAVRIAGQRSGGDLDEVHRRAAEINLARMLTVRFAGAEKKHQDVRDLDRAVETLRRVLAETPPGDRLRARVRTQLAGVLQLRATLPGRSEDLAESLAICRDLIAGMADDDPFRGKALGQLSDTLMTLFGTSRRTEHLDEAIERERQAAAAPGGDHVARRVALAMKLVDKAQHTGAESDVHDAVLANREVAADEQVRPWVRIRCAIAEASLTAAHWGAAAATEAYVAAVRLLPTVAWRGADLKSRERLVSEWSGLAADAAACAVSAGRPELAVELLEHGRSVLWGQTLQVRDELSELRATAPGLVARLLEVRTLLNADEAEQAAASPGGTFETDAGRRHRARWAREWEELVARARRIPGFEQFLAPPKFADLAAVADPAPVVLINVSHFRCDALVVADGGAAVVPLPGLDVEAAVRICDAFLWAATEGRAAGLTGALAMRANLASTALWLWHTVAEPVLRHLGHEDRPAPGQPWPQVCWSPVGPLSFLPLHAAGDHSPGGPDGHTVLDRVVSSYTPTLTALARVRRHTTASASAEERIPPSLLAIGMATTPGGTPLPYVPEELTRLTKRLDRAVTVTPLVGEEAERKTVLRLLDTHPWVHFACHGSQKLEDPGQGGVHLWDGVLTVREMGARNLPRAELAYLSACDTALGGTKLIDEAVHLAAALQMVGYPHVIATLWRAQDQVAPDVAETVYGVLADSREGPDVRRAAAALHRAVRTLRERYPHQPDVWAPYIHLGM